MIDDFIDKIFSLCKKLLISFPPLKENYNLFINEPNIVYKLSEVQILVEIWKFKPNSDQTLFSNFLGKNAFCYTFPYKSSELLLNNVSVLQEFKENFTSKIDFLVKEVKLDKFLFEGCTPWEYDLLREFSPQILKLK